MQRIILSWNWGTCYKVATQSYIRHKETSKRMCIAWGRYKGHREEIAMLNQQPLSYVAAFAWDKSNLWKQTAELQHHISCNNLWLLLLQLFSVYLQQAQMTCAKGAIKVFTQIARTHDRVRTPISHSSRLVCTSLELWDNSSAEANNVINGTLMASYVQQYVVYIPCLSVAVYVGQTGKCLNFRSSEHESNLQRYKQGDVAHHCSHCGCVQMFDKPCVVSRIQE